MAKAFPHNVYNKEQSDHAKVTSGHCPCSFVTFVFHNDLPNNTISSIRLYADDVILYTALVEEGD